jgi:hypothetical protein
MRCFTAFAQATFQHRDRVSPRLGGSRMSVDRELDKWAAWVLHRRDGDDREQHKKALEHLIPIRDRVLDNARIHQGETLLDVGTGDGLIAFQLLVDVEPGSWVVDWDRLLSTSPNPNAHTAGEAIRGALSAEEAKRFERHVQPLADAGRGVMRSAFAYLVAVKAA